MTSKLSPGQRAAATKRARYGQDGLVMIARKAYETRKSRRNQKLTSLERCLVQAASSAKRRATRAGMDCHEDLSGWALATMEAQGYRCALSGIPFELAALGHGAAPRPYIPSIDRIDAERGYSEDNIRIVCWAVNCFLGTWGADPAIKIARGMAKKSQPRR